MLNNINLYSKFRRSLPDDTDAPVRAVTESVPLSIGVTTTLQEFLQFYKCMVINMEVAKSFGIPCWNAIIVNTCKECDTTWNTQAVVDR